jgi:hypothetical protein
VVVDAVVELPEVFDEAEPVGKDEAKVEGAGLGVNGEGNGDAEAWVREGEEFPFGEALGAGAEEGDVVGTEAGPVLEGEGGLWARGTSQFLDEVELQEAAENVVVEAVETVLPAWVRTAELPAAFF